MKKHLMAALVLLLAFSLGGCLDSDDDTKDGSTSNPQVRLSLASDTGSLGSLTLTLFPQQAPLTVENFLAYVDAGHYDGLVFHRLAPGFVLQGGGFDLQGRQRPTRDPILNESDNRLSNQKYTLAMDRTPAPHSATAQFYINLDDNAMLDYRPATDTQEAEWGYAVFGEVTEGKPLLRLIENLPTQNEALLVNLIIERAERIRPITTTPAGSTP